MFMKYSIVTRIYTEILINQAVDNFTSSRFRESRMNARYFDVDNYVITVREVFDNTFAGWLDSREYPN